MIFAHANIQTRMNRCSALTDDDISWDDAVKLAYERYGEIRELAAEGKLKRKTEASDILLAAAADTAEAFKKIGDASKNIITHIHHDIEVAKDYVEGQLWQ